MIGVRIRARTNVGQDEEEVGDPHEDRVDPPADEARDDPDDAPMSDRDERRQEPDDHRDPGAVDGQVEHVAAELVRAQGELARSAA